MKDTSKMPEVLPDSSTISDYPFDTLGELFSHPNELFPHSRASVFTFCLRTDFPFMINVCTHLTPQTCFVFTEVPYDFYKVCIVC